MGELTEAQRKKLLDIKNDFYRFCDNNLYIRSKAGEIIKFVPNLPQRILIDFTLQCIQKRLPIRAIVLKARQLGLSTAIEALGYWWASTNKHQTSVIIGHEEDSAKNLYAMFRRYYDNSNPLFKPTVKYKTRSDLTFEKYDEFGNQVGLGSIIKTASARNTSTGRSDTVQFLHCSEVGEWSDGEELVASLLQTVPNLPNTFIFLESTAKGRDTYFYREWRAAERGENNFTPFFFAWWLIDEYEIWDKKPLGKLSDYEKFLVDLFKKGYSTPTGEHLTVPEEKFAAKIKFYRRKQKDFASDPVKMFQEYPSVAQEAFLASGGTVFPVMKLQQMEVECIDEAETEYFDLIPADQHEQFVLSPVEYDTRVDDFTAVAPLKVFEHPNVGSEYVIGADVAEGLKRGDYSVAEVVDTKTMKTVARWRGHIDPDRFGEILGALGAMYNYALIGVEINNHGLTTVQKLRDSFYTNLYKRERGYDLDFEEPTSNLGWKTDMRTKRLAINDLVHIVREGLNEDKDIVFINEAFSFVRDDRGRMGAESGEHDDVIMAKAIAFQLFGWGDTNIKGLKVYKKTKKHEVIK